jgi:hypothetical protein
MSIKIIGSGGSIKFSGTGGSMKFLSSGGGGGGGEAVTLTYDTVTLTPEGPVTSTNTITVEEGGVYEITAGVPGSISTTFGDEQLTVYSADSSLQSTGNIFYNTYSGVPDSGSAVGGGMPVDLEALELDLGADKGSTYSTSTTEGTTTTTKYNWIAVAGGITFRLVFVETAISFDGGGELGGGIELGGGGEVGGGFPGGVVIIGDG